MAQNFFIKITSVEGECLGKGHEKEIDVLSWSHSFNQPTSPTRSSAGGGTVEQANHADFSFTKYTDLASVPLMKLCWSGRTVPSAVFSASRSDSENAWEYLKVEMTDVVVSNISTSGGTGDLSTETVTLSYSKVRYFYTTREGQGRTSPVSAEHDLVRLVVR